jgi:hypothetical protein
VKLWIDDVLLVDAWTSLSATQLTATWPACEANGYKTFYVLRLVGAQSLPLTVGCVSVKHVSQFLDRSQILQRTARIQRTSRPRGMGVTVGFCL